METIILRRQICVKPEYINSMIFEQLLYELKSLCVNECSKDVGYIMNVIKIIKIIDNYINMDSNVVFDIKFEAEVLVPKNDKVFQGQVCMIFEEGIFVDIMNKMKILIPATSLTDYVFNKNMFIKGKSVIKENNTVTIKIIAFQYNNQEFNCFGTLI